MLHGGLRVALALALRVLALVCRHLLSHALHPSGPYPSSADPSAFVLKEAPRNDLQDYEKMVEQVIQVGGHHMVDDAKTKGALTHPGDRSSSPENLTSQR